MIHAMDRMQVEAYPKRGDHAVVPSSSTGQHAHLRLCIDDLLAERVAREAAGPRRGDDEKPVAVMGEMGRIGVEEFRAAPEGTWT